MQKGEQENKKQKGRWTRQCLNDVQNCHKQKSQKKRNHELKHMKLPFLVINQIFVPTSLSRHAKQKRGKEKAKTPKAEFPTKIQLPKCPIDP